MDEFPAGHVLDSRYEIAKLIYRGGMSLIYRAKDLSRQETVAIKVPRMKFQWESVGFSRFQREQQIGGDLEHPYVLKVRDIDVEKSEPYLVMEFLDGPNLQQFRKGRAVLAETQAVSIAIRLCQALEYLHARGIVHRDLKPENIMLPSDGSVRLIDFGVAKAAALRRLTYSMGSPTWGTPDYMAPEQVKGQRGDGRTDLYSLGAILYEMVTGHLPYEGDSPLVVMNARVQADPPPPRQWNSRLSPAMDAIIRRAMARDPADRYPDAAALRADLEDPTRPSILSWCPSGRPSRTAEWADRARRLGFWVAVGGFPLAIMGVVVWYLHLRLGKR